MLRLAYTAMAALGIVCLAGTNPCHAQTELSDGGDENRCIWVSDASETEPSSFSLASIGKCDPPQEEDGCGCCESCCPQWIIRAHAVFMERSRPDAIVLMDNPFAPTENLNAADFNFSFQTGVDASIIRTNNRDRAIEFRYFDLFDSNAAQTVTTNVASPLRINTTPPVFLVTGRNIGATYGSDLRTAEVNRRVQLLDWFTLLAGFRYVQLDEHFHADLIDAVTPAPTVQYDTLTNNDLFGFQLGGEIFVWDNYRRLHIEALGKAGIYGNDASHRSVIDTGVVTIPATSRGGRVAFLGEVGVTGSYRLTDRWSIRGGYQMMWIEGVTIATDQVSATNFITQTGFDRNGGVFYHGAFVGLEAVLP